MLPPLHKADGKIEFVLAADLAWDKPKIEKSRKEEFKGKEHPYDLYRDGDTRYELTPEVREFMRDGVRPTVFHLDHLPRPDWNEVQDMIARSRPFPAREYALRKSLRAVDDGGENVPLRGVDSDYRILTDEDMVTLEDRFGRESLAALGQAAIIASNDIRAREKKQ